MNILISRTDRAGDLLLTLPVFSALRRLFPHARLVAHVRPYTAPLLRGHPHVDAVLLETGSATNPHHWLTTAKRFRQGGFTHAILVHPTPQALLAAWVARIPIRIGRASNLWQFTLTHRQVQHRSRNEHHEAEYNLGLAEPLVDPRLSHHQALPPPPLPPGQPTGWRRDTRAATDRDAIRPFDAAPTGWPASEPATPWPHLRGIFGRLDQDTFPWPRVFPGPLAVALGRSRLDKARIHRPPIVIHPGHGGSAHNLSPTAYRHLVDTAISRGYPVAITLGRGEEGLGAVFPPPEPGRLAIIDDLPDLEALAGLLTHAGGFIGGSTGPMHLAAALQKPVLAFFPPRPGMTPQRWGPIGTQARVILPEVSACPDRCSACPYQPCMDSVDVNEGLDWLLSIL
jgi:heptosyltransferase III